MTTKPSYKIRPMSNEHMRWAVRDILRDPKGPLKGVRMPEAVSGGRLEPHAVVELLSTCGIRRGAKEFFARVLENEYMDAEIVDGHVGKYTEVEQKLAAKSLMRIILVNARDEKPDTEMEAALFQCMWAAERMLECDSRLALGFLHFCGSAAFGSESLKKMAKYCYEDDVCETAGFLMRMAKGNQDAVLGAFLLLMHQMASGLKENEMEHMMRHIFRNCCNIARECPGALYSFLHYFQNAIGESIGEGLFYMGLFDDLGVLQAFAGMGADHARIAELADEFSLIAKAAVKAIDRGEEDAREAITTLFYGLRLLNRSWPSAIVPFTRYLRAMLEDGMMGRMPMLAENFVSEENANLMKELDGDPRMQAAFLEALYLSAIGSEAN